MRIVCDITGDVLDNRHFIRVFSSLQALCEYINTLCSTYDAKGVMLCPKSDSHYELMVCDER